MFSETSETKYSRKIWKNYFVQKKIKGGVFLEKFLLGLTFRNVANLRVYCAPGPATVYEAQS